MVCAGIVLSLTAQAEEAPYALIVNKNLFSPNRTAWFMDEAQKKPQNVPKNIPRLDPKKAQLIGTVITAKRRRALISTSSRGSRKDTELYTTGDYFQGYLVKEIEPKKVVLSNQALNDECALMLNADKPQRSREKTALPPPARTVVRRPPPRSKAETTRDLQTRMKYARNVLKQRESPLVRKQVERDFSKLLKQFDTLSAQEQQEMILLKKEIDKIRAGKK
jgi:hypothetical protein